MALFEQHFTRTSVRRWGKALCEVHLGHTLDTCATRQIGQVGFHNEKAVRKIKVEKKVGGC